MKKIKLKESDIERLVNKIIKEDVYSISTELYKYMKEDHKKLVDDPEEFPWDGYVQSISDLYLNPTEDNLWERMDDNIFMWLYSKGVYSPDEMKDVMEKTLALDEFEDTQSDFDKIV